MMCDFITQVFIIIMLLWNIGQLSGNSGLCHTSHRSRQFIGTGPNVAEAAGNWKLNTAET